MIPSFGRSLENSNFSSILSEQLMFVGSALTDDVGSLAWCEAYAVSRIIDIAIDCLNLLTNQLTPASLNIYANRVAAIYNQAVMGNEFIPDNLNTIRQNIELLNARFGTEPNLANVTQFISAILGQQTFNVATTTNYNLGLFLDIEDCHNLIPFSTGGVDGYAPGTPLELWFAPMNAVLVRIWQPRDNEENVLVPTSQFLEQSNAWRQFAENWCPAYIELRPMNLAYDGYNDGYFPTISGTAGTSTITGTNSAFTSYFQGVIDNNWTMPIEVVADNNQLYSYTVISVASDTSLTIKETIINNFTNRGFRVLGVQCDTPYAADGGMLLHI